MSVWHRIPSHELETSTADLMGMKHNLLDHIEQLEDWATGDIPTAAVLFDILGKSRIRKEPLCGQSHHRRLELLFHAVLATHDW
jgi:hypothetical protein